MADSDIEVLDQAIILSATSSSSSTTSHPEEEFFLPPPPESTGTGQGTSADPVLIDAGIKQAEDVLVDFISAPFGLRHLSHKVVEDACSVYAVLTGVWWWVVSCCLHFGGPVLANHHLELHHGYDDLPNSNRKSLRGHLSLQQIQMNQLIIDMTEMFNKGKLDSLTLMQTYQDMRRLLVNDVRKRLGGDEQKNFWSLIGGVCTIKIDFHCKCTVGSAAMYTTILGNWDASRYTDRFYGNFSTKPIKGSTSVEIESLPFNKDSAFLSWPPLKKSQIPLFEELCCRKCKTYFEVPIRMGVRCTTLFVILRGVYDYDIERKAFDQEFYLNRFMKGFWAFDFDMNKFVYYKRTWLSITLSSHIKTAANHAVIVFEYQKPKEEFTTFSSMILFLVDINIQFKQSNLGIILWMSLRPTFWTRSTSTRPTTLRLWTNGTMRSFLKSSTRGLPFSRTHLRVVLPHPSLLMFMMRCNDSTIPSRPQLPRDCDQPLLCGNKKLLLISNKNLDISKL